MTNVSRLWHRFAGAVILVLLFWWINYLMSNGGSDYPSRPIQVVVPYGAGGGSDTFVRTIQKGIVQDDLLSQPLVIMNVPGGGATSGSRKVKDASLDGYKILCLHNAIITAKLAKTVDYGVEAFEPIAMTGELSLVIMVRDDAPYDDLRDLLNEAKRRPKQIKFGANKGAPAYFATLHMQRVWEGAAFNIVSGDGGAERYSKLLGGHLDAGIFSLSEYFDYRLSNVPSDQNIRAIAVMATDRHPSIPDVPCSMEQGVPVLLSNAHYWWAPKGTPKEIVDRLADVFQKAMKNEMVAGELKRLRVDPVFLRGDALDQRLDETVERFKASAVGEQSNVPDFTIYTIAIVVALCLWVVVESLIKAPKSSTGEHDLGESYIRRPGIAMTCFAVVLVYVYVLGRSWLPYVVATTAMVWIVGTLMTRFRKEDRLMLIELALLTGLGTQFVFTAIFETILP